MFNSLRSTLADLASFTLGAAVTAAVVSGAGAAQGRLTGAVERSSAGAAEPVSSGTSMGCEVEQARLREQVTSLREELEVARFGSALVSGQLATMVGAPQEWPASLPEQLRPEGFRAELTRRLASEPDLAMRDVDCREYPCVAVLDVESNDLVDVAQRTHSMFAEIGVDAFGDDGFTVMTKMMDKAGSVAVAIAVLPEGEAALDQRTSFRAGELLGERDLPVESTW